MTLIMLHGMGQNASSRNETVSFLPSEISAVCPELSEFFTGANVIIGSNDSKLGSLKELIVRFGDEIYPAIWY